MKKLNIIGLMLAMSMAASAQLSKMPTLVEGDAKFLLEDAKIYYEFIYQDAVEYEFDKKSESVKEIRGGLLDSVRLGENYAETVDKWSKAAEKYNTALIKQFNNFQKKNKFAAQITTNIEEAKYIMTCRIDSIDEYGSGAAAAAVLIPVIAMTTAYDIGTGSITVTERETGKVVFKIAYNNIYNKTGGRGILWARLWGFQGCILLNCLEGYDIFSGAIKKGDKGDNYQYIYPENVK